MDYEKSHPWLKFEADFRKADISLWIKIGEIQAKCDRIANTPLMPEYAEKLHLIFIARGALATTAIEGNTLSEKEALEILKGESKLPEIKRNLEQEVKNIIGACQLIFDRLMSDGDKGINVNEVLNYNSLVLKGLPLEAGVVPGTIRTHAYGVPGYRGVPANECQYLLEKMCDWLNTDFEVKEKDLEFAVFLIKAILSHLYLVLIHPFADGNGRTARLIEFKCLLSSGVPTATAHLLSNYYNETRDEYYRQLRRVSASGGDIWPFVGYAIDGLLLELRGHLDLITEQQIKVHWTNYIHEHFREKTKKVDGRRKHVALELGKIESAVPITKIRDLSPEVARRYGNVSLRSVQADIKVLKEMGLVLLADNKVEANKSRVLGMLPKTVST